MHGATGTSYNYTYRMHDARIGRFLSIDPLAAKYPWNSPYAFSENRVIDSGELEGLESVVRIRRHFEQRSPIIDVYNYSDLHPGKAYGKLGTGILSFDVGADGKVVKGSAKYTKALILHAGAVRQWIEEQFGVRDAQPQQDVGPQEKTDAPGPESMPDVFEDEATLPPQVSDKGGVGENKTKHWGRKIVEGVGWSTHVDNFNEGDTVIFDQVAGGPGRYPEKKIKTTRTGVVEGGDNGNVIKDVRQSSGADTDKFPKARGDVKY